MALQKSRYRMAVFTFVLALVQGGPMFAGATATSGTIRMVNVLGEGLGR